MSSPNTLESTSKAWVILRWLTTSIVKVYPDDPCTPGVLLSFIRTEWYGSIQRFRARYGEDKVIIVNEKGPTPETVVTGLALKWRIHAPGARHICIEHPVCIDRVREGNHVLAEECYARSRSRPKDSPPPDWIRTCKSSRGNAIALASSAYAGTVLSVELYPKWYGLQLVRFVSPIEIQVEEIPFPDTDFCEKHRIKEAPYSDHAPNPVVVRRFAQENGYELDELAEELIVGRWLIEAKGF